MRTALPGAHTQAATLTVLRLPPGLEAVVGECGDHILNGVADGVGVLVVHLPGVAHKAVGLLLMDRLCTFRPQRRRVFFFYLCLFLSLHSAASHPV